MANAQIQYDDRCGQFVCRGDFRAVALKPFSCERLIREANLSHRHVVIDVAAISHLDTAGAWLLLQLQARLHAANHSVQFLNLSDHYQALIDYLQPNYQQVARYQGPARPSALRADWRSWLELQIEKITGFFAFIGEFFSACLTVFLKPRQFQYRDFLYQISQVGINALGIIGLLSFLIGIVLAYEMGTELRKYGIDIYIVKITGIAMVREFAPLITAIILAGRTSAAFTAELGMMRFNAEIDALQTMGLSAMQHLIIPRVLGVAIVMPLLIFWADLFGVLGSMVMSKAMFELNFSVFLIQFHQEVSVNNYFIGFIKAPLFALLIAVIGCFQGMQTYPTAESIGKQTTKSVVQTLFFIVVADALFSVIFSLAGL